MLLWLKSMYPSVIRVGSLSTNSVPIGLIFVRHHYQGIIVALQSTSTGTVSRGISKLCGVRVLYLDNARGTSKVKSQRKGSENIQCHGSSALLQPLSSNLKYKSLRVAAVDVSAIRSVNPCIVYKT